MFTFCTQTGGECNFTHTSESVNLYYQMEVQICTQADDQGAPMQCLLRLAGKSLETENMCRHLKSDTPVSTSASIIS